MRIATLAFFALSLAACRPPDPAVLTLSLDGEWSFRGTSDVDWVPATVPGTVHTDLLAAGHIPDPFSGDREAELSWIEEQGWTYRRDFDVDPGLLREERLDLVFEGLDTWATVTLNDATILQADNMFRIWRVDVARTLREGTNTLEVRFAPPIRAAAAGAGTHPWPIPHQEPDSSGARAFSRKAAYHFGWDWGPRYVTTGIWRPVRLEAWSAVRIVDARVASMEVRGDTAYARIAVELEGASTTAQGAKVRLGVQSLTGDFEAAVGDAPAPGARATPTFEVPISVPSPELWWPRGAGQGSPRLYDIEVVVRSGPRQDSRILRMGLRTVELVTEADTVGESFFFNVNGEPLFVRGANVVPPDHFTTRTDSAAYARIVGDAVAANMNMLRVWGGGVYLPDVFYDLADAAGLLVWQDFMFANTLVPGDEAFAASVAAEAQDQVRRLRRHPSLALWCGNNEIAEGWADWGWRDEYTPEVALEVEAAYRNIFEGVLPDAVTRLDEGRPYLPSSPRLGWGHAESLTAGDSHYWGVWWGGEPFRAYAEKVPRFASEFGFQALPDPVTVAAFGDSAAPASLSDPVMRAHQKYPTGFETIRAYLGREWPVPPDDSLDAWSYVSQLAQAEGVGRALEAHRRSWPRTGGSLYWQLNDTWPVVSWSSLDHFGRWKALHYRARDVFAPVAVLADVWDDTLAVWVASDAPQAGAMTLRVLDFRGSVLATQSVDVSVDPGSGLLAWRGPVSELLPAGTDPRSVVVVASLEAGGIAARDLSFLVSPVRLALPDPQLRVLSAEPRGDAWSVTLTGGSFAYGVRLAVDGVGARFSDNYAHLLPGDTLTVLVTPEAPVPDLPSRLRLRALRSR
ncbi:MAG: glycoside hydrolase family 2 protein [Longimicrobiales bacterium]|nr:glycoside hydrolase family 2 protein [Longimicrobiales bacterium]